MKKQHLISSATDTETYVEAPRLGEICAELSAEIKTWPKLRVCPICEARSLSRLATIRHFPYSRCRACGFTFANPRPPIELYEVFYNSPYYSNYRRLEMNRIRREGYFSISMYRNMREMASWLGDDQSVSILDCGCGTGTFLALLRDKFGFANVTGCELSRTCVEFARRHYGLTVTLSLDELSPDSCYDLVILTEVIEHHPNPASFLGELSARLRPGGHILVTTPAVDNLAGRYLASQCMHYTAPSHISLFTTKALIHLLSRIGFGIERLEIDEFFPTLDRMAMGLLYDLDFVGPRHDHDQIDIAYIPNALGRLLGRESKRVWSVGPIRKRLQRADRILARHFWRRLRALPRTDHLYVLARKSG